MVCFLQTLLPHPPLLDLCFSLPVSSAASLASPFALPQTLSGFASVPVLSLPPSAVPLFLSFSSSLSRVYESVGLPVSSSQPFSAPALLSILSHYDWLSYKPFSQELWW